MNSRRLDPKWAARRLRLHERFEELHPIRDASHFAYMRGPEQRFTESEIARLWAEATTAVPPSLDARNHVYVHVPFCKSICDFCNYERLRPSSPVLLQRWEHRVLQSIEAIAPQLATWSFHSLYFGGGTPSTLPASTLDRVLTALGRHLRFVEGAGRHFELDPAVISGKRIDVLKKHGFTRFSFGIQTLDANVNAGHNRGAQGRELVDACFDKLHGGDVDRITVDFLIGLEGTTPAGILADIAYVLEHQQPLSVDIFALVPTQSYVQGHFGGDTQAFWAHLAPFQQIVPAALPDLCERFGYQLSEESGHRYTLKRRREPGSFDPARQRDLFSYSQLVSEQQRPLNLLGFGTSARNQIFGRAAFQYFDPAGDVGAEGPAEYRGHRVDTETEVRTYLVHQLRDRGEVDAQQFEAIFGLSLQAAIPIALSVWTQQGAAALANGTLRFRPASTQDRARSLLWLVPDPQLEYEVARIIGLDLSEEGIENLFGGLPVGQPVVDGYRFWGAKRGRVHLKAADHKVILRVAPPLRSGDAMRLVVESGAPPSAEGRAQLAQGVKRLRALLTRWHGRPDGGRRPRPKAESRQRQGDAG